MEVENNQNVENENIFKIILKGFEALFGEK